MIFHFMLQFLTKNCQRLNFKNRRTVIELQIIQLPPTTNIEDTKVQQTPTPEAQIFEISI